jgi:hypothetical protein
MNIESNTKLSYKDGNRRITVQFHNQVKDGIYFSVNIKQASKSFTGGDGYYNIGFADPIQNAHPATAEMVRNAIEANS